MFEDNPAVRMISGAPHALDIAGGFAVWDAGWIWQLILAVWAILTTTRFLRGEEDLDRSDLVLAGPGRRHPGHRDRAGRRRRRRAAGRRRWSTVPR